MPSWRQGFCGWGVWTRDWAATLRGAAADLELVKLEDIGGLTTAIFERVARTYDSARGLFSADAAAAFSEAIGREVCVEEIQPLVNELPQCNSFQKPRRVSKQSSSQAI